MYHNSGAADILGVQKRNRVPYDRAGADFSRDIGVSFFIKFDSDSNNNGEDSHPFIDPKTEDNRESVKGLKGLQAGFMGIRSDARSAVNVWGDEDFTSDEGWFRYSFKQGPSMFGSFTDGTSPDLIQLPADIGTNAHISNAHGGPLWDIHRSARLHGPYDDQAYQNGGFRPMTASMEAFASCSWLRKQDADPEAARTFFDTDSAFGFAPKNPRRIQFRPLKMELYAGMNNKLKDFGVMFENQPYFARRIADMEPPLDATLYPPDQGDKLVTPDRYLDFESDPGSSRYRGLPQGWKDVDQETRRASWGAVFARHTASEYMPVDVNYIMGGEESKGCKLINKPDGSSFDFLPFMIGE